MSKRRIWSVLCMVIFSVLPAVAQTQAGISGVIHDPSGAVIPGVTVTVTNPATNFVRSAISNEAGVYNFPVLQPGVYNIKVELPGFRTIEQNDVELQVQQSARIDFTLQVGDVSAQKCSALHDTHACNPAPGGAYTSLYFLTRSRGSTL